jgi:tetratricopeptide (TPR) repeat protein
VRSIAEGAGLSGLAGINVAGINIDASPSALYDAALHHFQAGRMYESEESCRQALILAPRHADSLHLIGLIRARTNQLDQAIEFIAEAIRSDSKVPDYFFNLGTLLQRQGRLEEALKSYDLALNLKPDFVAAWISLGDLLRRQNRYDEALLTYDHALALDPGNVDVPNKSGLLLI